MNLLKSWNNLWLTTKVILAFCLFHSIWFYFKLKMYSFFEIQDYLLVLLAFPLLFLFLEGFSRIVSNKFIRSFFSVVFIALYFFMGRYHFRVRQSFDFSILADNFNEMFHKASFGVMSSIMKPKDIAYFVIILIVLGLFEVRKRIFSNSMGLLKKRRIGVLFLGLFYLIIHFLPYPYEEFSYVTKTALDYYFPKKKFKLTDKEKDRFKNN